MAELRHFLNVTIEKSGSRTRMAQRFDEGSDALLRRDFALKPVNALRCHEFLEHGASRSPLSILTILDSVRLLN